MSHHKHYTDAGALLAQLHGTTPEIAPHEPQPPTKTVRTP